jgi:hypothetical protein
VDSVLVDSRRYPSIFVVMRDIHGITGRGVATTTFYVRLQRFRIEGGCEGGPDWETFKQTDVGSPNGAGRPSPAGACGEPNTPMVEADVYSLRTRRDGSTAVDGHLVIDEFG